MHLTSAHIHELIILLTFIFPRKYLSRDNLCLITFSCNPESLATLNQFKKRLVLHWFLYINAMEKSDQIAKSEKYF